MKEQNREVTSYKMHATLKSLRYQLIKIYTIATSFLRIISPTQSAKYSFAKYMRSYLVTFVCSSQSQIKWHLNNYIHTCSVQPMFGKPVTVKCEIFSVTVP